MTDGKPYQSKLIPYADEIFTMRRKRPPMPYSQIASLLNEKYQLSIGRQGVFEFFKRRVIKKPKQYKYDAKDYQPTTVNVIEHPQAETPPLNKPFIEISRPVAVQPDDDDDIGMQYSDVYNLNRVSTEESEARLKIIKERNKK